MGGDNQRTLRLALAMRGGISLAVWIGGAVAELDVLRRSPAAFSGSVPLGGDPDDTAARARAEIYAHLLAVAGYNSVEMDVLAGASAGGLNAVLYGVAQSARVTVDGLREVWVEVGDISRLLRPSRWTTSRGAYLRARSVMRGDEVFLRELTTRLRVMLGGAGRCAIPDPPEHLTVALSATVMPSPGVPMESDAEDGRAHFHFVGRPAPPDSWISEIPRSGDGVASDRIKHQIARLALAGRSTSSFPGAFEPGRIFADKSCARQPVFHRDAPDMIDVFSAARDDDTDTPFEVVDGGVFDNIPIARGLEAITRSPATGPTDRRLVYLDPDPPKPPAHRLRDRDPKPGHRRPVYSGLATIRRVLVMRWGHETELTDLEAIRDHNQAIAAHQAAVGAYVKTLRERLDAAGGDVAVVITALTDPPAGPGENDGSPYVRYRAASDRPRLTELLLRPQRAAGRQMWFSLMRPVQDRKRLLGRGFPLEQCYGEVSPAGLRGDLTALIAATEFLIGWCRAAQRWSIDPSGREQLAGDKQRLYRILTTATAFRDRSEHELPTMLKGEFPDITRLGPALKAMWAAQRNVVPKAVINAVTDLDIESIAFHGQLAEALELTNPDGDSPQPSVVLAPALWGRLGEYGFVERLSGITPAFLAEAVDPTRQASPYLLFGEFPVLAGEIAADVQRLGPLFAPAGGPPGISSEVQFEILSGDERSPWAEHLPHLRTHAVSRRADRLLRGEIPAPRDPELGSKEKLAGNTLGNFGGFLSARWRANDWTWGRADAAAAIPRILLSDRTAIVARLQDSTGSNALDAWNAIRAQLNLLTGAPLPPPIDGITETDIEILQEAASKATQACVLRDGIPAIVAQRDDPSAAAPSPSGTGAVNLAGWLGDELVATTLAELAVGAEGIGALSPARRGNLTMRVLLAAIAMVWPTGRGLGALAGRLLLVVLRPVLMVAALALVPARLAAMIGLVLLGPALVSDRDLPWSDMSKALIVTIVAVASALVAGGGAWRTRRRCKRAVATLPAVRTAILAGAVADAQRRSRRQLWALTAVAGIAALGIAALWSWGRTWLHGLSVTSYLALPAVAAIVPLAVARKALRCEAAPGGRGRWQNPAFTLIAAAAVLGALVLDGRLPAADRWVTVALAVSLTTLSVVDWLSRWAASVAVLIAGLGALGLASWPLLHCWHLPVLTHALAAYGGALVLASALLPARGEALPPTSS